MGYVMQGEQEMADDFRRVLTSKSTEWYTPPQYIEAARTVMGGIDLDPASNAIAQEWIRARRYYTLADDGLAHEWRGRVWLNPPYGKMTGQFVSKFTEERLAGRVTEGIVLANSYSTDTAWFQVLWDGILCFTKRRIKFVSPCDGKLAGSTHGSVFVYFGEHEAEFVAEFSRWGPIVKKVGLERSPVGRGDR